MLNREKSLSSNFRTVSGGSVSEPAHATHQWQIADPGGENDSHPVLHTGPVRSEYQKPRKSWARRHFLNACQRHWSPEKIDLRTDQQQWQTPTTLSEDERSAVARTLGFLQLSSQSLARRGIMDVHRQLSDPECHRFLLRQAYEEGLHHHAIWHVRQALALDDHAYPQEIDSNILNWLQQDLDPLSEQDFNLHSEAGIHQFLRSLVTRYVLFHGLLLRIVELPLLSIARRNKLCGSARTVALILRDQIDQTRFGIDLVNQIKIENPEAWNTALRTDLSAQTQQAIRMATRMAYSLLPRGLLELNAPMLEEYLGFLANRFAAELGLDFPCSGASNPFPWMEHPWQEQCGNNKTPSRDPSSQALNWDH